MRAALLALFFASSCGPSDEDKLRAVVDRMCECTDAVCAKRVSEELHRVGAEIAKDHGGADILKLPRELAERNNECVRRAMTGEAQGPK